MASLLTNAAAMTALQTLTSTNKKLATTQNRIATGERVSEAADNAASWSIATDMRSQNQALSAVQDTIGLGQAVIDTAYTGISEAVELTKDILEKHVALEQMEAGTAEADALEAEITALLDQIAEISGSASFQGMNLLADGTGDGTFVIGFTNNAVTTVTVSAFDLDGVVTDITAATDAAGVKTQLDAMVVAAGALGAAKIRIDSQAEFTSKLRDAIDRGIGQLVDADMNAESAKLSALQVQQQLGIQALSIANSSSPNILTLFRN
jgi:flagellin